MIKHQLLWLLALAGVLGSALAQAGPPLHLETAQTLSIESQGYSAPPYEAHPETLPLNWQTVSLPHALPHPLIPAQESPTALERPTLVTWYRLPLPVLDILPTSRYIYIPRWKTDGQIAVYGGKRLLFQSHANTFWNGWNIPLWIALDETAESNTPTEILIRIQHPRVTGGGISTVWLGENDNLGWRYQLRYSLQAEFPYMSSAAFLTAGLFSLLLWLRQRKEKLFLWFFLVSLASFLRTLHYHVGANRLLISDEWFSWITVNSLFWLIAGVHFFLNHLHRRSLIWLDRSVVLLTIGVGLITLPVHTLWPNVYVLSPLAYIVLLIMGVTVGVAGFFQSKRAQTLDGKLLGAGCLMGMVFWLHDWLLQNNHIGMEGIYIGPYTNAVAFLLFLYIMFRRYVGAINEVTQVNANLEQRLQARENQLEHIYREQRDIAHRQTLADERQRIMQDMHDGLGSTLRTTLLAVEKGQIDNNTTADLLKDCIDDLKLTIDAMEPVQADLLLVLATLRYRLEPRLESAGIALRWEIQNLPALNWLDPRNALHILRILQEAFTNIIKHTQASEIRVVTSHEKDWIVVSLIDNGQGFDVAQCLSKGGKGLKNQLSRAASIGAKISWDSSSAGTCVRLGLPIQR